MVGPYCVNCLERYWECECDLPDTMTNKIYTRRIAVDKEHIYAKSAEMDLINNPPHYTNPDGFPQVIEVLMKWFPKEPLLWQVGKYIARWDRKDTPLENLKKARYYLNVKIKELDPNDDGR